MRILVTGGTVFVSRFTAEYLTNCGHEVYVLNRNSRPQSKDVNLINCDRNDIGEQLKNIAFDLVIDVAVYNETDAANLANALGDFGNYIMISSSAVYPETLPQPFSEEMPTGFNIYWEDYGTNKISAEKYVQKYIPDAYIIRPPYLCGKMNNLRREAFVFECAESNLPFYIPKDGKMKLQFFDVEDLCRLIMKIVELKPDTHIINCGNPTTVSINEWVKLCYGVLDKTPDIRYAPSNIEQRMYFPFRDYEYILDVTKQQSIMPDVKPLEVSMAESYEWFRNNCDKVVQKDYLNFIQNNLRS